MLSCQFGFDSRQLTMSRAARSHVSPAGSRRGVSVRRWRRLVSGRSVVTAGVLPPGDVVNAGACGVSSCYRASAKGGCATAGSLNGRRPLPGSGWFCYSSDMTSVRSLIGVVKLSVSSAWDLCAILGNVRSHSVLGKVQSIQNRLYIVMPDAKCPL